MNKEAFIGRKLKGGYKLDQVIGEGSFGSVFMAREDLNNSIVAVKLFMPPSNEGDIEKEARIQGSLHHPNIVPFHWFDVEEISEPIRRGVHTTKGYPFIVMQYANGGSLRDRIQQGGRPSTEEAIDFLVQAATGVQYAHENKILHRDLKPANLLLHKHPGREHVDVLVSDFGIAVKGHKGGYDFTKQFPKGTIKYASPEQLEGKAVFASDVYSLGAIAFELLTGSELFSAETTLDLMNKQKSSPPPKFEEVRKGDMNNVLAALEEVVNKAIEKDPKKRPQSAGDFAQDLKDVYERINAKVKKGTGTIKRPSVSEADEAISKEREEVIEVAKRLMEKCIKNNEFGIAGKLALELDDKSTARSMVSLLEKNGYFFQSGELALKLGDKASAKRVLVSLETQGYYYQAGELALQLGDRDMARKMLTKTENHKVDPFKNMRETAPFSSENGYFGENASTDYCLNQSATGELAFKLRDFSTVQRVIQNLEQKGWYKKSADLAFQLGDFTTVHRMIKIMDDKNMNIPVVELAIKLGDTTIFSTINARILSDKYMDTGNGGTSYYTLSLRGERDEREEENQISAEDIFDKIGIYYEFGKLALNEYGRKSCKDVLVEFEKIRLFKSAGRLAVLLGDRVSAIRIINKLEEDESKSYQIRNAGEIALELLKDIK